MNKNMVLIAVFSPNQVDFENLRLISKDMELKRVRTINDIRGRTFTAVLLMLGWYECFSSISAYDELVRLQPELFD